MKIEATYIVTKSQLAAAFELWQKECIENPDGFNYDGDSYGERCATHLIKLIKGE